MKRVFRRLFARELELVFGLATHLGLRQRTRAVSLERRFRSPPPERGMRRSQVRVEGARPGASGWEEARSVFRALARHRTTIFAATISILAHAAFLAMLGKITFLQREEEPDPFPPIQLTLYIPRDQTPLSSSPRARKVEPPAPQPAPPPLPPPRPPEPQSRPDPSLPPGPPANPVVDPTDEPGSPGTGTVARKEPEGRPGPPAILGVGASPPSGDRDGLGGEGEGDGMGSRTRGKAGALRRFGGSSETEDAVSKGLRWLADHQDLDGGWSAANFGLHCHHFTQCLGRGLEEFDTGVTALCALAFLGAGQGPGLPGPYGKTVERALESLIAGQRADGALGVRGERYFYNHAIATFALCEAYSVTKDLLYLKPALAALNFSALSQQSGGGWDYTEAPTGRNDLSITGWQVMAFRAAQTAGLPVPEETLRRAREFLLSVTLPNGESIYANKGMGAGRRGINMAAVGLLSRLYLGAPLTDPRIDVAADRLMGHPPDQDLVSDWDTHYQSSYYWYSATLCHFHLGGARWDAWNHFLKRTILPLQSRERHEEGSWAPDGNWLGAMGGRIYTTAMNVLTLEVYYRYPPLHAYRKNGVAR